MNSIKIHPIHSNYGYDIETNEIVHIPLQRVVKQHAYIGGYCTNTFYHDDKNITMSSHRFIWECCNDIIPKGYEIDHIDKNRSNNHISNLRCITIQENRKNRDMTNFLKIQKIAHTLKRFIKSTNIETNEIICFPSKSQAAKYQSCIGLFDMRREGKNGKG